MDYHLPELPLAIPHSKIRAFLADIGIDGQDVHGRGLTIDRSNVTVDVMVRDPDGRIVIQNGTHETVTKRVEIPIAEDR